jgi:hypothetical protein
VSVKSLICLVTDHRYEYAAGRLCCARCDSDEYEPARRTLGGALSRLRDRLRGRLFRCQYCRRRWRKCRGSDCIPFLLLLALASPLAAQEDVPMEWDAAGDGNGQTDMSREVAGIEPATVSTGELFAESVSTRNLFAVTHQGRAEDNTGPVEQSPDVLAESELPAPSLADYIAPAAWCPLRSGSDPADFGCDGGLAFSLIDRSIGERYTAVGVAFVGAETVGLGMAWCRGRLCAGAGVAATRDDFGVDLDSASPVIGATFSLGGLRE